MTTAKSQTSACCRCYERNEAMIMWLGWLKTESKGHVHVPVDRIKAVYELGLQTCFCHQQVDADLTVTTTKHCNSNNNALIVKLLLSFYGVKNQRNNISFQCIKADNIVYYQC